MRTCRPQLQVLYLLKFKREKMKSLLLSLPALLILFATGCTTPEEDIKETTSQRVIPKELKKMDEIDLSADGGFPLSLFVPDTTKSPLEIITQDWGETEIISGSMFKMKIAEGGNIALRKQDISDDLLYKGTIISEEDRGMIYKQEIDGSNMKPMFHFYLVVSFGDLNYEVQDINDGEPLSEDAVKLMYLVAKNMVVKASI